jgi:hypothetical protein
MFNSRVVGQLPLEPVGVSNPDFLQRKFPRTIFCLFVGRCFQSEAKKRLVCIFSLTKTFKNNQTVFFAAQKTIQD